MIEDPFALVALIAGITALAFWLDRRFTWGATIGASLLVIIFGAALSNAGVVPRASPVYDAIFGPVTSLAIVWLLFAVDLRDLRAAGGPMLLAFAIAVAGTCAGVLAASLLFADALGDQVWRLAGAMTGTYAGGSLNFVAMARELDLSSEVFSAATAADNVLTAVWMGMTLMLPSWLGRYYPGRDVPPAEAAAHDEHDAPAHPFFAPVPLRILDVTLLIALGAALITAADAVTRLVPAVPSILWLTTLALAVGHVPAVARLSGSMQLGTLALHLFFAVIGIGSVFAEIFRVGPEIFLFTLTVVVAHGIVVYGGCWLARLDVGTTSVASQAAVGGPSTALALAVARDWPRLALPGLVAGLLGYAAGNYVGFGVAQLVRALVGG
jgi:uncharacterized membrane protein